MIQDEDERDDPVDFTWFYFIGKSKLGLSFKETGRLTLTTFNKLYKCYKNDFDMEMLLKNSNTTYEKAYQNSIKNEEWF